MINKTYIRVITLVLAVLMVLGMLAPMFTRVSFAASLLEVQEVSGNISATGTPNAGTFDGGEFEITIKTINNTAVVLDAKYEGSTIEQNAELKDSGQTLE